MSMKSTTFIIINFKYFCQQIRENDINFWKFTFGKMEKLHKRKMYPPRVKMTVSMRNPKHILKLAIKFAGCSSDCQLDVDITFPLGKLEVYT